MKLELLPLVIYVVAVARITRLINFDAILDRPRVAIVRFVRGNPLVVYFLTCPWCVGFWVTLATSWIPVVYPTNRVFLILGVALAASHLIGIQAPLAADETVNVDDDDDESGDDTGG